MKDLKISTFRSLIAPGLGLAAGSASAWSTPDSTATRSTGGHCPRRFRRYRLGALVEEIARRARLTRGAFYHHFTDTAEIYASVLAERWDTFMRPLFVELRGAGEKRLRSFLVTFFSALETDASVRALMAMSLSGDVALPELKRHLATKANAIATPLAKHASRTATIELAAPEASPRFARRRADPAAGGVGAVGEGAALPASPLDLAEPRSPVDQPAACPGAEGEDQGRRGVNPAEDPLGGGRRAS